MEVYHLHFRFGRGDPADDAKGRPMGNFYTDVIKKSPHLKSKTGSPLAVSPMSPYPDRSSCSAKKT